MAIVNIGTSIAATPSTGDKCFSYVPSTNTSTVIQTTFANKVDYKKPSNLVGLVCGQDKAGNEQKNDGTGKKCTFTVHDGTATTGEEMGLITGAWS